MSPCCWDSRGSQFKAAPKLAEDGHGERFVLGHKGDRWSNNRREHAGWESPEDRSPTHTRYLLVDVNPHAPGPVCTRPEGLMSATTAEQELATERLHQGFVVSTSFDPLGSKSGKVAPSIEASDPTKIQQLGNFADHIHT
jgi:hypothetical protein